MLAVPDIYFSYSINVPHHSLAVAALRLGRVEEARREALRITRQHLAGKWRSDAAMGVLTGCFTKTESECHILAIRLTNRFSLRILLW